MSPLEWLLAGLIVAVVLVGLLIATAVRQACVHLGGLSHLVELSGSAHRLAVSGDKLADDQPAQKQARHYQDMSEKLILGISTVLNTEVTHPEGLKDDVITGRNQGIALLKEQLETELINAQK